MVVPTKQEVISAMKMHGIHGAAKFLQVSYADLIKIRKAYNLPVVAGANQYNQEHGFKWSKLPPFDVITNTLYRAYKIGANKRKHAFNITLQEFKIFAKQNCFYCNNIEVRIVCIGERRRYYRAKVNGVDRVNSNKGYILNNCVPCCSTCNYAKRHMSTKEFISWIRRIYDRIPAFENRRP